MEESNTAEQRVSKPARWQPAFLAAFAELGNITEAAKAAGIHRITAWRRKTLDPTFAKLWTEAEQEAADVLEREAWRRAHDGVDEPQFYKGEVCGTVKRYSDNLLMFLLKGVRPEKYRERFVLAPGELDRAIERELALAKGESEPEESIN